MSATGIILAGGKSSRMGQNKALLDLSGKKIIEIVYEKIKQSFNKVLIISNTPEDYRFMGLEIHQDIFPGLGPLAGIHSGLVNSKTNNNFIISCDLPLISTEAVEYIINLKSEKAAAIFKEDNRLHYLCGIYKKESLPVLESSLISGNLKVQDFITKIDADIIEAKKFSTEIFFNLNTMKDYEYLKSRLTRY